MEFKKEHEEHLGVCNALLLYKNEAIEAPIEDLNEESNKIHFDAIVLKHIPSQREYQISFDTFDFYNILENDGVRIQQVRLKDLDESFCHDINSDYDDPVLNSELTTKFIAESEIIDYVLFKDDDKDTIELVAFKICDFEIKMNLKDE